MSSDGVRLFAIVGGLLGAAGIALFLVRGSTSRGPVRLDTPGEGGPPSSVMGLPASSIMELPIPESADPSIVLAVHSPSELIRAISDNRWLADVLKEPIGRGFLGSWAGFLGTRGEDLRASFSGAVIDVLAERLLVKPFQVVWFSGDGSPSAPAIVMPEATTEVIAAYEALDRVAHRGGAKAASCPEGASTPEGLGEIEIARWLIADHPFFAARTKSSVVLGRSASAVLHGVCADRKAEPKGDQGADFEILLYAEALGREAQLLFHLLGVGEAPRLAFAVDGSRIVPRGIAAELVEGARLASAGPLSAGLLELIPEETPVLLTLQLRLPAELGAESLKAALGEGSSDAAGEGVTRQVALLWNPRGDPDLPTEVALIWSRIEDAPALAQIWSGKNALESKAVCGHQVLASTGEVMERIERTCAKKDPSMSHAQGEIAAGFRSGGSLLLGVHFGRLLSGLLADAYRAEAAANKWPGAERPEIERARRTLEALPFFGLRGSAEKGRLVPGGFRS